MDLLDRVSRSSFHDIVWLRNSDLAEGNSSFVGNVLKLPLLLHGVEGEASSSLSCSSCSSSSVDVGFRILGGFNLDNQVDIRNVDTSSGYVSCNKYAKLSLLEPSESDFSLILSDVTMHDFDVLVDLLRQQARFGFCLGGCEHNSLSHSSVDDQDISECLHTVMVWTVYRNVVDVLLGLGLQVLCQIDHFKVWLQVVACKVLDPSWNSG